MRVNAALLRGFAEVWTRLAGGRWLSRAVDCGELVIWEGEQRQRLALPDRMYGLTTAQDGAVSSRDWPRDVSVNLPPGVRTDGDVLHAIGHLLPLESTEQMWSALSRVGRQGVRRAEKTGCSVTELGEAGYHRLASEKSARLGGRPPHPELMSTMQGIFGGANVGCVGVVAEGEAVASVLWVTVDGYGMLVDGASSGRHWDKNPNNLAVWSALEVLHARGCALADYGFSPPDAGDLRFKKNMGGQPVGLYCRKRA